MLYKILKLIVSVGIRFYYKEVKILNCKSLSHGGPLIIIANHPNTLMDAMMIGYASKEPVYFIAKGTLFNSKFKLWLLRNLNMIPINRQGEGTTKGVSNQDSFEECYRILELGKTLVIFPEGTSFLERNLRELKSGTARIALEVEKRNNGNLNLKVVALGLNYLKAEKFRSSVLINIGGKLGVIDFLDAYNIHPGKAAKELTEKFRINLESVLVNSYSKDEEKLVDDLTEILASKYIKQDGKGVEGEITFLKEIRNKIEEIRLSNPLQILEIQVLVQNIQWRLRKMDVRADFLDRRFRSRMFLRQLFLSVLFLIIGLPFYVFGIWHNLIQFKLTNHLVPMITKDVEYFAPIAVLLGLFLYPSFYILFFFIGTHYFEYNLLMKIIYFISMPLSGMFSYWFSKYLEHISFKWKYILLMINDKEAMLELKEKRNQLRLMIFGTI